MAPRRSVTPTCAGCVIHRSNGTERD
jgi:hypothetical protein